MLYISILITLLALSLGSFVNVCICRLPFKLSLSERSRCMNCGTLLKWLDLFPVLSYVFTKGKCRYCSKRISFQYPVIELLAVIITWGILLSNGFNWKSLEWITIAFIMLPIMIVDYRHYRIPNELILTLVILGVINFFIQPGLVLDGIKGASFGLVIIFSAGALGWLLYSKFGFGMGDVKLFTALGLLTGFKAIVIILVTSVMLGAITGVIGIISGKLNLKSKIPFGVFTAISIYGYIFLTIILKYNLLDKA